VLIDTPGLIEGVNPLSGDSSDQSSPRQRAVRRAAREAYELVLAKCKQKEYILLCVDDTNDWKLGARAASHRRDRAASDGRRPRRGAQAPSRASSAWRQTRR
jgi:hypothetical protein